MESWLDESWKLRVASFGDRVAVRFTDIMSRLDKKVIKRSKLCAVRMTKADTTRGIWSFRVQSQGSPDSHLVNLKLVSKGVAPTAPAEQDFETNCDCGHWQFWGPDYSAAQQGYLRGRKRSNGAAPDIRDPRRRKLVCKHVVAAFQHLTKSRQK